MLGRSTSPLPITLERLREPGGFIGKTLSDVHVLNVPVHGELPALGLLGVDFFERTRSQGLVVPGILATNESVLYC
jgi:hypothetical protein